MRPPARSKASSKLGLRARLPAWVQQSLASVDKPGWRAFAISIVALAFAFLLAMYSTIFAQQGRVIATGLCALSALGLATYVGFTAIPYLARRTQIEWLQVSLDYKLTNEGWAFILLILMLAVAGLNTGNNLLYMIVSTLLAALLMSGMLSLAVLNGVSIELEIPRHIFARRPVEAIIILENLKKFFPSFSLTLQGVPAGRIRGTNAEHSSWRVVWSRAIALGVIGGVVAAIVWLVLWKVTSDFFGLRIRSLVGITVLSLVASIGMAFAALAYRERKRRRIIAAQGNRSASARATHPRGILDRPIYFPFLARGATVRRGVQMEFPRRGHYREEGLNLSTRFPFGFLEKTMHVGISHDVLVYPPVQPSEHFLEILPLITGEVESFQKGLGHDLYSLREMVGSDSVRHVDWKASARTGTLMVREFAREDDRRVQLVLDTRVGRAHGRAGSFAAAQFEAAVEFCACLAWHFRQQTALFQLVCGAYRTPVAPAGEIIYDVLEHLAEVEPSDEAPDSPLAVLHEENVFRIVCTGMRAELVFPAHKQHAHFVYFSSLPAAE
jgi:uncharacterized protein (DUF58 family)